MKTAKEWFDELQEPYKSELIENLDNEDLAEVYPDFRSALDLSITYAHTPQGDRYWRNIYDNPAPYFIN